jgi:hypothetical protein
MLSAGLTMRLDRAIHQRSFFQGAGVGMKSPFERRESSGPRSRAGMQ